MPEGVSASPLRSRGAVFLEGPDHAVPAHYGSPLREQRRLLRGSAVVDLAQLEILQVSGAEHRRWLTTITSQVIEGLSYGDSAELAVLSPQGRVEHLAAVAPLEDGSVLLITDPGRRAPLRSYLEAMRFAARVDFKDRDDLRAIGSCAPLSDALAPVELPEAVAVWKDPWPAVVPGGVAYGPDPEDAAPWFVTVMSADALTDHKIPEDSIAGMLAAEALRIASHRPRLVTEVDEKTIPHEIDLLRTAVHTSKGCYRGQETVAKVLNLGQPPRRMVMLHLDGSQDVPASPGCRVLWGTREVGAVTSTALHTDLGPIALALIRRAVPLDAPLAVRVTGESDDDPCVLIDATQELIVVPRDHGERPQTARL